MAKLCKSRKVVNSSVNPKNWFYGLEQCREISYASVPAGETILPLNLIDGDSGYVELLGYIHFTNGGSDPAPVGLTKLATVDAAAAADVDALYVDIKTELEGSAHADLMQIQINADGTGMEILNSFIGLITEETGDTSGATVAIGQQSFGGAIGVLSEEGASASFEFEKLSQTGDVTGNQIIEEFLIGATATISMSLTDTSVAKFKELFIKPLGGVHTEGADEIIGFGTDNFFKSLIIKAGKLVGHDAGVAYSDRSNDWSMLASISPSSMNFNKELQVLETEFVSYYDATMPETVNIFRIGKFDLIDFSAL